jgi:dihydroorotate dehydrogenase electron transfer subunit
MSGPMHQSLRVREHVRLARDTYRIRLHGPELAAAIRPGQFVMLRLPRTTDPLLGRPFALYDTVLEDGRPVAVDVVYLVVGKMTGRLVEVRPGESLEVWGPLGNDFAAPVPLSPVLRGEGLGVRGSCQGVRPTPSPPTPLPPSTGGEGSEIATLPHVALVAGGIGQTPFLAYTRQLLGERGYAGDAPRRTARKVSFYYGVRTAELAAGVEDFRAAGAEVHLASDDGTLGERGYVTGLLAKHEPPDLIVGCGPEPMLHALSRLAETMGRPCHVSLETPMACGVGICFSCVVKVKTVDGVDYKRCCIDGPVFDAARVEWG